MTWEEFLIIQAHRCIDSKVVKSFFIQLFTDEKSIDLPVYDLSDKYDIQFKTCAGYRTTIFNAFGESESQKDNDKLKPLYTRLKKEFERENQWKNPVEENPRSPGEKLHELLQFFNYRVQERVFQDSLDSPATAFLVRVDDSAMQEWLVWRLVEIFSREMTIEEKPSCYMINASNKWGPDPQLMWDWLAQVIACDSHDPNDVLEAIADRCRTQSLVFVLHEIAILSPDTLDLLLNSFWKNLTDKLKDEYRLGHGKCRLFLTEADDYNRVQDSDGLIVLNAWTEVTVVRDMRPWIEYRPVMHFLCQTAQKSVEELEKQWLQGDSLGKPNTVIKRIGQDIELKNCIDEMRKHWQLAA
jgi:hypothetical protein